jgi:F-type H+-transporting ATPase subunit alpha
VGGSAQIKAMKQVSGTLRLDLAQYREKQAFAQFGSDLDAATQRQLARGQRLVELLKQGQYEPSQVEKQVVVIYAGVNGYLDQIPVNRVKNYEKELMQYLDRKHPDLLPAIATKKAIDDEIKGKLTTALKDFGNEFGTANV